MLKDQLLKACQETTDWWFVGKSMKSLFYLPLIYTHYLSNVCSLDAEFFPFHSLFDPLCFTDSESMNSSPLLESVIKSSWVTGKTDIDTDIVHSSTPDYPEKDLQSI